MSQKKDADGMANCVDPDQEQPYQDVHCLLWNICLKIKDHYGK